MTNLPGTEIGPYKGQMMRKGDLVLAAGSLGTIRFLLDIDNGQAIVCSIAEDEGIEASKVLNLMEVTTNTLILLARYPRIDDVIDTKWLEQQVKLFRHGDGEVHSFAELFIQKYRNK